MIYIAPVQGHTDAAWRHFHSKAYGGNHVYFTPFIRNDKGGFRDRDLRDFTSDLNNNLKLIPQVIFKDRKELIPLLDGLSEAGASSVDLNMGCPFPLQTVKGRGAAFIGNIDELSALPEVLKNYPEITFSIKMRLGFSDDKEWRNIIDILNELSLSHIAVHPRVAKEQYGGEIHYDEFNSIVEKSLNPVVYNGDIKTPGDWKKIKELFPNIYGFMIGRGVLGRPSLISEIESGVEVPKNERLDKMLNFHNILLKYYESVLCGDSQILSKIKPFWEYSEDEIGRKAWKSIKKASNMAKYHSAVAMIRNL